MYTAFFILLTRCPGRPKLDLSDHFFRTLYPDWRNTSMRKNGYSTFAGAHVHNFLKPNLCSISFLWIKSTSIIITCLHLYLSFLFIVNMYIYTTNTDIFYVSAILYHLIIYIVTPFPWLITKIKIQERTSLRENVSEMPVALTTWW